MKKYEFLSHTSEIKFRAYGKTLNKAFENSIIAISKILSRGVKINPKEERKSIIKGEDNISLLYNLINEVLYLLDSKNFVVSKAKINFDKKGWKVNATFYGDNAKNYENLDYIKSATYSEMQIKNLGKKKGWMVQVVVDV